MSGRPEPYVFLDDARPGGAARLYRAPVRVIEAHRVEDVAPALDAVRAANAEGLHAAGYLAYEAGAAFERALPRPAASAPLLWFGLFERWEEPDVAALLPDPAGAWVGEPRPCIEEGAYADEFAQVRELIAADSGRPTTFGWGPRFLHSTGQYHKGGPANGVFLQITERTDVDLEIPGRPFTFGRLIEAQASGDAAVLAERGRPVVTLTLTDPATEVLTLFEAAQ